MRLPVDVGDLLRSRTRLTEDREQPVRIAVFVDVEAPSGLVEAVRDALRPQTSGARIHVEACEPGETLLVDATVDAVIALAGLGTTLFPSLVSARDKFVPTVVLALDQSADAVSLRFSHPLLDTVAAAEPEQVVHALGRWLVDRLNGKRLAMATNFAFMRRAVSEEAIKATSFQNGVVGLVMVIPGADMPVMTANQAKMVLQIAAAYGQTLGAERIKELAVVLGGGFALRAVARQALAFIPGFGWAVKAGIGYTGTMAMGYAALEHFEAGGEMGALAARVKSARDRVIEAAQARVGRGEPAEEILEANGYVVVSETPGGTPALEPAAPPATAIPNSAPAQDGAGAQ
jgi:uncharacterized protein (DUF697 family)